MKRNFKSRWLTIRSKFREELFWKSCTLTYKLAPKYDNKFIDDFSDDEQKEEINIEDSILVDNLYGDTFNLNLNWSDYQCSTLNDLNSKDDCFKGILWFIYYRPCNKINLNEIQFGYKNAKFTQYFKNQKNITKNFIDLFDYNDSKKFIKISTFFQINFKRISVRPICYSICSINLQRGNISSWIFEGFNGFTWVTLDERININLVQGKFILCACKTNDEYYSTFRLRTLDEDVTVFGISAFEIHGNIKLTKFEEDVEELPIIDFNLFNITDFL